MSTTSGTSGRFRMNESDWVCEEAQCGNVNFARRTSCNRCGKEKAESSKKQKLGTEIGKVAAEKSRGLFSADDWQCSKCGNVNWARRQSCNMCNAPKFGEVEERTGYGGGYNERENVEYIEREESDDEFDEFGRKKKKFRSDDTPPERDEPDVVVKPVEASKQDAAKPEPPKVEDEEDEEEDDEDDDDADLSKYDLCGDEDDPSPKPRSRSSSSRSSHSSGNSNPASYNKRTKGRQSRSRSRSSSYDSRSQDEPDGTNSYGKRKH